jgi:hypothetical protein
MRLELEINRKEPKAPHVSGKAAPFDVPIIMESVAFPGLRSRSVYMDLRARIYVMQNS